MTVVISSAEDKQKVADAFYERVRPGYCKLTRHLQEPLDNFAAPEAYLTGTILDAEIFLLRKDYGANVSIVPLIDMEAIQGGKSPRVPLSTEKPSLLFHNHGNHWRLLISTYNTIKSERKITIFDSLANNGKEDSWFQSLLSAFPQTNFSWIAAERQTDGSCSL